MKNALIVLLFSSILFSCNEFANPDSNDLPQEWILKGYKSVWVPQDGITPITDSTYFYNLNTDGSFVKTIGQFELTGTFEFETGPEGQNYVTLTYDEASLKLDEESGSWGLIHYCGQNFEPFTILDSKTVQGSWGECDGPILIFNRR